MKDFRDVQRYHPSHMFVEGYVQHDRGRFVHHIDYDAACDEIDRLHAELARQETHRNNAVEAERADCVKALTTLSGAGICTPEETYGTNSSWAISDLCRAVTKLSAELKAMTENRDLWRAELKAMTENRDLWRAELKAMTEDRDLWRAELKAMTEDRDLWRDEHDGDCPNMGEVAGLRAELAEEEKAHEQTLAERDAAEDALGQAYTAVVGEQAEWSNVFGYDDAINEMGAAVKSARRDALEEAASSIDDESDKGLQIIVAAIRSNIRALAEPTKEEA